MGLERRFKGDGTPAYVLRVRPGKRDAGTVVTIVYVRSPEFKALWDKAEGDQGAKVDKPMEPR